MIHIHPDAKLTELRDLLEQRAADFDMPGTDAQVSDFLDSVAALAPTQTPAQLDHWIETLRAAIRTHPTDLAAPIWRESCTTYGRG